MTAYAIFVAVLAVLFVVGIGLMEVADRRWRREHDDSDEG